MYTNDTYKLLSLKISSSCINTKYNENKLIRSEEWLEMYATFSRDEIKEMMRNANLFYNLI